MQIVVTGAAGFIGINLCQRLLAEGHMVIGVDNFYCSNKNNLQILLSHSNFSFIEHDIINPLDVLKDKKIDAICNFACPASPIQYLKNPIYTTKVSCLGILNILELATERNIPILHASTSEIYGDPIEHPQTELYWGNVNSIGVRACYDEGKRLAESLCFDFVRQHKTQVKVIRIFNTYGPYMAADDGRVMSNFIMQALEGKSLSVYGDGTQTRSFCFVDDLVRGIITFLTMPIQSTSDIHPEIHGPINLGNPKEITINQLTNRIQSLISNCKIEYKALPENDPQQRKPDITRAKKVLQWEPKVDLEDGMKKTIEWFRHEYNI